MNNKRKNVELIGAQGLLPAANKKVEPAFDEITRGLLSNKYVDFQPARNFGRILEKSGEYLKEIAQNYGARREAALTIAKKDANFGIALTSQPDLSLKERIAQEHKSSLPKPKPNFT